MRRQVKYFKVYKDGNLFCEGYLNQVSQKTKISHSAINYRSKDNKNFEFRGYKFIVESVNYPKFVKDITIAKRYNYKSVNDEYETIVTCLKRYGNTSLIKKELKYLDRLKQEFNLDIVYYPKRKRSISNELSASANEDWVITDLDYFKRKHNDL